MINSIRKIYIVLFYILIFITNVIGSVDNTATAEIRIQKLSMELPPDSKYFSEILLPGEITDTEVKHIIMAGPQSYTEILSIAEDNIFLFVKGEGTLSAGDGNFEIEEETIAIPSPLDTIRINVADNDTLHYLIVRKKLTDKDLDDIKSFPEDNRKSIYFKKYKDCEAYTEKIKSPNTVSRTVLPNNYVPRVAMGTVETIGPDEVGAHEHPMLDQLFLGLRRNDVMVYADDKSIHFPEYSILHIPIGSSHWVTVEEGKKMYYQWMDFFLTKEGEEWLKTHKQTDNYKKK